MLLVCCGITRNHIIREREIGLRDLVEHILVPRGVIFSLVSLGTTWDKKSNKRNVVSTGARDVPGSACISQDQVVSLDLLGT